MCGKISSVSIFSRLYYLLVGRLARFVFSAQSIIISGMDILFFGSGRRLNFAGVCPFISIVMRSYTGKGCVFLSATCDGGVAISSGMAALSRSSHHSPCDSFRPLGPKTLVCEYLGSLLLNKIFKRITTGDRKIKTTAFFTHKTRSLHCLCDLTCLCYLRVSFVSVVFDLG